MDPAVDPASSDDDGRPESSALSPRLVGPVVRYCGIESGVRAETGVGIFLRAKLLLPRNLPNILIDIEKSLRAETDRSVCMRAKARRPHRRVRGAGENSEWAGPAGENTQTFLVAK